MELTPEELAAKKAIKSAVRLDALEDEFRRTKLIRGYMTFIWLFVTSIMIWFMYGIATQLQQSFASPGNQISFGQEPALPFPSVTVCNWNQLLPPLTQCPECELYLDSCFEFGADATDSNCTYKWIQKNYQTSNGYFYCWEFNNDPDPTLVLNSHTTGYAGSIATVWKYLPLPKTNPSVNRAAVQTTFAVQNTTTPDSIYGEISFAPAGFDSFFALTYINTVHMDLSQDDANYNVSRYEKTSSTVELLIDTTNETWIYSGVSFAYESLSVQYITYSYTYTLLNFWGDFAGMIGTLMGLDAIKVSMGVPTAWFAFKVKSSLPLEDLFNG